MKKIILFITALYLGIACQSKKENENPTVVKDTLTSTLSQAGEMNISETFWKGYINKSIPIYLHYQIENDIIVGEIIYLNTQEKQPIKIIGSFEEDQFRLLEFESSGNISGIITGTVTSENHFVGDWFSPKTRKNFTLDLTEKDTTVIAPSIIANKNQLFGKYHYGFSDAGPQGYFSIEKLNDNQAVFEIESVTSDPARNLATVDKDTITLDGTNFTYTIPDSDNCSFRVQFYKDFATIMYTNGYCSGQFGHNATIDGTFLKIE